MAKTLLFRALLFAIAAAQALSASAQTRGAAAPDSGAQPARRPRLLVELSAGPTLGMDRALRGGKAGLSLGIASGRLSAAARGGASYDASLGCFFAECGLSLGLGGGTRLFVGGEIALGEPTLMAGGAALPLRPAGWPGLFALSVPLARLARGGPRRPELLAEAELSYSAYRVDSAAGVPAEAAGIAGFSSGFRAYLGARLSLGPRRP